MNTLNATLFSITSSSNLACITCQIDHDLFHVLLAEHYQEPIGTTLKLAFKETEVILSLFEPKCTANGAYGIIQSIRPGTVLSEICFDYKGNQLCAIVPTLTFIPLNLSVGMQIGWTIQPNEISLIKGEH